MDRAPAGDENPVAGQEDLVLVVQPAGQELHQPARRQHLGNLLADDHRGQAEQPPRLLIGEGDGAIAVGGDGAFVDPLKARLPLLEQAGDLIGLEPESLSLEPRGEQQRTARTEAQREQNDAGVTGKLRQQLLIQPALAESDRGHPDHRPAAQDRRLAAGGGAEGPRLDTGPGVAGEHDRRVLVDGLADQGRVRMGEADPLPVGDHDVGGAGRLADLLGGLLDGA